jgi:hypothetical protein
MSIYLPDEWISGRFFSQFGYILSYHGMTEENVGNGAKSVAFAVRQ